MSNTENMRNLITLLETVSTVTEIKESTLDEATLPRMIPPNSTEVKDDQSSAVVYIYDNAGIPVAKGYNGRAGKPAWHYRFKSPEERQQYIDKFFNKVREAEAYKKERKAASVSQRDVTVGDIFSVSWGATMTFVDYYQVIELVGNSSAVVQQLQSEIVDGDGWSGHRMPIKDNFAGKQFKIRVNGKSAKIDGHYANIWNGRPGYFNSMD